MAGVLVRREIVTCVLDVLSRMYWSSHEFGVQARPNKDLEAGAKLDENVQLRFQTEKKKDFIGILFLFFLLLFLGSRKTIKTDYFSFPKNKSVQEQTK